MRSWPSWLAIVLGVLLLAVGFLMSSDAKVAALLLPGAILLAAGLHSLQATYDSWCGDCADGGCGSCGSKAEGHAGHDHPH